MLNRRHIRAKVMQSLYTYYNSAGELTKAQTEKNLSKSMEQLYSLYLYYLQFLVELGQFVTRYDEEVKAHYISSREDRKKHLRLYNNPIIKSLLNSKLLQEKTEWYGAVWQGDIDLLRKVFLDLKNTEEYRDYLNSEEPAIYEHEAILSFIIKHYPNHMSLISTHFEEQFYNWTDDKKISLQMANKTLKTIASDPENPNFLQPLSPNDEESYTFANKLYSKVIEEEDHLDQLIAEKTAKFEPNQVSKVDQIILRMGISEFLYFSSIPTKVSLNEYIELAKNYSSPMSKKFVNGVLDNVLKDLKAQGEIRKTDRGLYEN